MPADEIKVETPGAAPVTHTDDDAPSDPRDMRIVELEGMVAQLGAALSDAQDQVRNLQTVPARVADAETGPRLIGEDWSNKTSAEAKAAGVTKTVRCSDGYYVPG